MKIFFGETFLNRQDLVETAICHLIKLKYYKILEYKNNYGIEIVKEEYINGIIKIETNQIYLLTEDETKIDKILSKILKFKVTPIGLDDTIVDMLKA